MIGRYVKNFFIVLGLFILSQLATSIYGIAKAFAITAGDPVLSSGTVVALTLLTLLNILLMIWLAKKLKIATFDFSWSTKRNWLWIIGSFLLGRVVAVVGTSLIQSINGTDTSTNDAAISELFIGESPLLLILLLAVAAPIMEEITFRGGIIGLFLKDHPVFGLLLSSAIFGCLHSATTFVEFLLYATLGFVMGFAYYKTQRLEVSIMVHFFNNGLAVIGMLLLGML